MENCRALDYSVSSCFHTIKLACPGKSHRQDERMFSVFWFLEETHLTIPAGVVGPVEVHNVGKILYP